MSDLIGGEIQQLMWLKNNKKQLFEKHSEGTKKNDVRKMYLTQATLEEFGFTKRMCHRGAEVCVVIPELVFIYFLLKKFSLRLFLYFSYFSSDFSLNVLIKVVLNKIKECMKGVFDCIANSNLHTIRSMRKRVEAVTTDDVGFKTSMYLFMNY